MDQAVPAIHFPTFFFSQKCPRQMVSGRAGTLGRVANHSLTRFLRQLAQIKHRRGEIASNGTTPTERADFSTAFSLFFYAASHAAGQFDRI